jgi:hypothetical protein
VNKIIWLFIIVMQLNVMARAAECAYSENEKNVVFYGHSFLSNQAFANKVGDLLCAKVYNFARGGSSSDEVAFAAGAIPVSFYPVGGVIPESGSVELLSARSRALNMWDGAYAFVDYAGIPGTIGVIKSGGALKTYFKRKYDGNSVTVKTPRRAIVLPITRSKTSSISRGVYYHKSEDISVLWVGRNSDIKNKDAIVADLDRVISTIRSSRFLIMPEFPYSNEAIGTEARNNLDSLNSAIKARYPNNYCEIGGVDALQNFMNHYNPENEQDVNDLSAGVTPTSLRMDRLHPSDTKMKNALYVGTDVNAEFVARFVKIKGW